MIRLDLKLKMAGLHITTHRSIYPSVHLTSPLAPPCNSIPSSPSSTLLGMLWLVCMLIAACESVVVSEVVHGQFLLLVVAV